MSRAGLGRVAAGIAALALLALVLAYFAGAFHANVQTVDPGQPARLAGVAVAVTATEAVRVETVPGTIRATDETLVAARIMANVLAVNARAGDRVREGALLVELDGDALAAVLEQRRQQVIATRAAREEAELNRDRVAALFARGNVSRAAFDTAATDLRKLDAELERAERAVGEAQTALSYTRIRAPMEGVVVERYVEPGDMAAPGQTLLALFNPGRLRIEATVRESLIRFVEVGDTLTARLDALDERVHAVVEEIVPAADPGSRAVTIKARLGATGALLPGMFARLEIVTGTERRLRVPAAAVERAGQLEFVTVRGADGDRRRYVRTGRVGADGIEIRSGLAEGETVVVPSP